MLKVTVSGSFHRFMPEIERAVQEFNARGVRVLSPAYPKVVDYKGEFLFVASDRVRSIRLVQDRHLSCIRAADFLWLVCPGGYVGQSASMELGFAIANQIPVFSTDAPSDVTLRQYVEVVHTIASGLRLISLRDRPRAEAFLIDPHASIETAHQVLERISVALSKPERLIGDTAAGAVYTDRKLIGALIGGQP